MSLIEKYDLTKTVCVSNDILESDFYKQPALDLTIMQQQLVTYLFSCINKGDTEFKDIEIKIKDYCELFDIADGGNSRDVFRKSIVDISKKVFILKLDENQEQICRWIGKAKWNWKKGTLLLRLDDSLMPYLMQLRNRYIIYQLGYSFSFKSKYSMKLYWVCKTRINLKKTFYMSVEELKTFLLNGQDANAYNRFSDFKKRCIEPAIKDINEFSDIMVVDYKPLKKGRNIESIAFYMRKKTNGELKNCSDWKKKLQTRKESLMVEMESAFEEIDNAENKKLLVDEFGGDFDE